MKILSLLSATTAADDFPEASQASCILQAPARAASTSRPVGASSTANPNGRLAKLSANACNDMLK